ncbi:MAG: hypothetical protein M1129_00590 [Candidatus Thermoplasmatota archaeon]|nr:hypothetical protein [Candidatus Thermoplasmatota archaeon]MCL5955014.1 hypothetical protein [Candidatus Thermoplasmatota archaeon]
MRTQQIAFHFPEAHFHVKNLQAFLLHLVLYVFAPYLEELFFLFKFSEKINSQDSSLLTICI